MSSESDRPTWIVIAGDEPTDEALDLLATLLLELVDAESDGEPDASDGAK